MIRRLQPSCERRIYDMDKKLENKIAKNMRKIIKYKENYSFEIEEEDDFGWLVNVRIDIPMYIKKEDL